MRERFAYTLAQRYAWALGAWSRGSDFAWGRCWDGWEVESDPLMPETEPHFAACRCLPSWFAVEEGNIHEIEALQDCAPVAQSFRVELWHH